MRGSVWGLSCTVGQRDSWGSVMTREGMAVMDGITEESGTPMAVKPVSGRCMRETMVEPAKMVERVSKA